MVDHSFERDAKVGGFSVRFSPDVARVLLYSDRELDLHFSVDASAKGDGWLTLEHHPRLWDRPERYDEAFARCRRYLEACGYKIDVYGS